MNKLWIILASIILSMHHWSLYACDVCKENQPKVLANITHGTGPSGDQDYVIIWTAVVIVTITLLMSIKYLVRPGEQDAGHIKQSILN
jgi:hypothetical protein